MRLMQVLNLDLQRNNIPFMKKTQISQASLIHNVIAILLLQTIILSVKNSLKLSFITDVNHSKDKNLKIFPILKT